MSLDEAVALSAGTPVCSRSELMDVDLHLLDIKSGDPAIYQRVTRQPLAPTLAYARRLSALGRPSWVRFVLVPGLTDGRDNVERLADIAASLRGVEQLGLAYPLAETAAPSPELLDCVRTQLRARGLVTC